MLSPPRYRHSASHPRPARSRSRPPRRMKRALSSASTSERAGVLWTVHGERGGGFEVRSATFGIQRQAIVEIAAHTGWNGEWRLPVSKAGSEQLCLAVMVQASFAVVRCKVDVGRNSLVVWIHQRERKPYLISALESALVVATCISSPDPLKLEILDLRLTSRLPGRRGAGGVVGRFAHRIAGGMGRATGSRAGVAGRLGAAATRRRGHRLRPCGAAITVPWRQGDRVEPRRLGRTIGFCVGGVVRA